MVGYIQKLHFIIRLGNSIYLFEDNERVINLKVYKVYPQEACCKTEPDESVKNCMF